MTDLSAPIDGLLMANDVQALWAELVLRIEERGFARLLYGFTRFRTAQSLGDPDDLVVLSTLPRSYLDGFQPGGPLMRGPMIRWALDNVGALAWPDWLATPPDYLGPPDKDALAFNASHGVLSGYTISFPTQAERFKGAMAVIGQPDENQAAINAKWAEHGAVIERLAHVFHLKLMSLPLPAGRVLTERQREVLEWVGDGKTTQDIAVILGLTPATVEKHMRLAREAMDVDTTAQAVLKAAFQNQMYVRLS